MLFTGTSFYALLSLNLRSRHWADSALPEEVTFFSWFSATCGSSCLTPICWNVMLYPLLVVCLAPDSEVVLLGGFVKWVIPLKHLLCCCWVPLSALAQSELRGKLPDASCKLVFSHWILQGSQCSFQQIDGRGLNLFFQGFSCLKHYFLYLRKGLSHNSPVLS